MTISVLLAGSILFTSCASWVQTSRSNYNFSPTPLSEPITVYDLKDTVPKNSQQIGTITIGDTGFSVDCGWEQVLEKAKEECRAMGGNGIKLMKIGKPNFFTSTCYRIYAYVLKIPENELIQNSGNKQPIIKTNPQQNQLQTKTDRLRELKQLVDEKLITQAEYENAKKKILDE